MVRQSDLNALAALVEAGADIASLDEFPTYVVEGLPRLVPCDSISYNEVDPDPPRLVSALEPASLRFPGDTELWERYMHQHPVVARYLETRDGRAFKISDFLARGDYRRLELYRQLYRRLRTEFQIAVCLPSPPPLVVGSRSTASGATRPGRPQPGPAPPRAGVRRRRAADAASGLAGGVAAGRRERRGGGRPPRPLRADRARLRARAAGARRALRSRRSRASGPARGLGRPHPVGAADEPRAAPARRAAHPHGSIRRPARRAFPARPRGGEPDALVLDEPRRVRAAGLTAREVEVLRHVANGLTNAEIAANLAVSRRTVEKHLERAYAKLRVETRTAAVAKAFDRMR